MYKIKEFTQSLDYFSNHPKDLHSITQLQQKDCELLYPKLPNYDNALLFYSEAIKKTLFFHSNKIIVQETNEEYFALEPDVTIHYVTLSYDGECAFILEKIDKDIKAQFFFIKQKEFTDLFGFEYPKNDQYFKAEFSNDDTKIAISTCNYIQVIYVRHREKQLFFKYPDLRPTNISWNNESTLLAISTDCKVYVLDEKSFIPEENGTKTDINLLPTPLVRSKIDHPLITLNSPLVSLAWSYQCPNLLASLTKEGEISALRYTAKPDESIEFIPFTNMIFKNTDDAFIPHLFWSRLTNDPSFYLINRKTKYVHIFCLTKQSPTQPKKENLVNDLISNLSNLPLPKLILLLFFFSILIIGILSTNISLQFILPMIFIIFGGSIISYISEKFQKLSEKLSMFFYWFKIVTIIYFAISFLIIWLHWDSVKIFIFNTDPSSLFETNVYVELLSQLFTIYKYVLVLLGIGCYYYYKERPKNSNQFSNNIEYFPNHIQFFRFSKNEKRRIAKTNSESTKNIQKDSHLKFVEKKPLESIQSTTYLPPSMTPYGMRIFDYYNEKLILSNTNRPNQTKTIASNKSASNNTNPTNEQDKKAIEDKKTPTNDTKPDEFIKNIQKKAKELFDSMIKEEKEEAEKIAQQREKELKEREEAERKAREEREAKEKAAPSVANNTKFQFQSKFGQKKDESGTQNKANPLGKIDMSKMKSFTAPKPTNQTSNKANAPATPTKNAADTPTTTLATPTKNAPTPAVSAPNPKGPRTMNVSAFSQKK